MNRDHLVFAFLAFWFLTMLLPIAAKANPWFALNQAYTEVSKELSQPITKIPPGPILKVGITHPHVSLVVRRINEIYGTVLPETDTYNSVIKDYVMQFQAEKQINDDGIVGSQTRASLNVGPEDALKLIDQALQEWNTVSAKAMAPTKYIIVNIPSYELIAYEWSKEVFRSRIIVGTKKDQTPTMVSDAYSLKFNPDWTAPPGMRKDYAARWNAGERNYFEKNGVQVSYDANGRLRFWQPPSRSYLGDLKIELDNPYFVYLHDTNNPSKFSKSKRAMSRGCVRVQDYVKLAAWLSNTTEDSIQKKLGTGKTFWQSIDRIPVIVVYMLAYPGPDDTVGYFEDVYGRVK